METKKEFKCNNESDYSDSDSGNSDTTNRNLKKNKLSKISNHCL